MSQGKGEPILLSPIEVNAYREQTYIRFGTGAGYDWSPLHPRSRIPGYIERQLEGAIDWLIDTTENSKSGFSADFVYQLQLLPSTLQSEISTTIAAAGAPLDFSLTTTIARELNAVRQLIYQRSLALPQIQSQANLFFSSDPLTKSRQDFVNTIAQRDLDVTPIQEIHDIYPVWAQSYSAAYSARLVTEALRQLNQRAVSLTAQHATALAQQAQQEAEARALQAQREAQERALQAQREAEALRVQQEAEAQKRREDEQRLKAEQEAAQAKIKAANTFSAVGAVAASRPFIVGAAGVVAEAGPTALALAAAIRAAFSSLQAIATAGPGALIATFATLTLYSPKLGNADRFAISVPLSELDSTAEQKGESGASTIDLPVRIGSNLKDEQESYFLAATGAGGASPSVRSVTAQWDPKTGTYGLTTTDSPARTLTWTPIVEPGNSSTENPSVVTEPPVYPGVTVAPIQPQIETFPAIVDLDFDDYIIWFPADSGLKPIYIAFRSRRYEPGVVTGVGQEVSGRWLESASQTMGAAVPSQIADQLRGREFRSFDGFRRAFWKAVAMDSVLSKQFSKENLTLIHERKAPIAPLRESAGKKEKFEIHHQIHISNGGAVYDLDNLIILTPRRHIEIHSRRETHDQ